MLGVILTALASSYTARCCTKEAELAATESNHLSQACSAIGEGQKGGEGARMTRGESAVVNLAAISPLSLSTLLRPLNG